MYHTLDLSNSVKTVTFPMKGQYKPIAEAWYYMLVCVRELEACAPRRLKPDATSALCGTCFAFSASRFLDYYNVNITNVLTYEYR